MLSFNEVRKYRLEISIVFLGSLLSYYFNSLGGIRIFDFVSFVLLIYGVIRTQTMIKVDKRLTSFLVFFLVFVTFSFFVSVFNNAVNIHIPRILGTYFAVLYAFLFYSYFSNNILGLINAVKYTALIHASFFYTQFLLFNLGGTYIDFIEPLTGNSSRNIGGQFTLDTSIRASGLYSEPAAYSLFILTYMSIYIYYKRKISVLDLIILVSVLLSMSASGMVYLSIFIAVFFFYYSKSKVSNKIAILISMILIGVGLIQLAAVDLNYLVDKARNYESSVSYQYRIGNADEVIKNLNDMQLVLGIGYANMDIEDNKGSTYSALFIEQGYLLGGVFLFGLFLFLHSYRTDYGVIFFIFILLLGTHAFSQIQFWIWIISIVLVANSIYNERKNIRNLT